MLMQITVPSHLKFSDLELAQNPTDGITFNLYVIKEICKANQIPFDELMRSHEDNISAIICNWYRYHIKAGGEPDTTMEGILGEIYHQEQAG